MLLALQVLLVWLWFPAFLHADKNTFDCKMRQLALEYGTKLQPFRSQAHFQMLADALNGSPEAKGCNVSIEWPHGSEGAPAFGIRVTDRGIAVYVDGTSGSDSGSGTVSSPFKTIGRALQATRAAGPSSSIILRKGTYYLSSPILLTPVDNGLTIQNYPNEQVFISGAQLIQPVWKPYNVSFNIQVFQNSNNVYGQAVSRGNTTTIKYLGSFDQLSDCQSACLNFHDYGQQCNSFTFHTPQLGTDWARQCFAVVNYQWSPTPEANIISGKILRPNIYVADLSSLRLSSINGLRINSKRAIRARYPNGDPELKGFGSNLQAVHWLPPKQPIQPDVEVNPDQPFRDSSDSFQKFQLGIGGPCSNFDPPAGYWCGNHTEGGGAFTYRIPTGMVVSSSLLPNLPTYKNPVGGIIQTWRPGHWSSWMFEIGSYDASTATFTFSKGGFQGARGADQGDNFYIENVFEELDSPDEWFYDANSMKLYLWYNGTGAPLRSDVFEITNLKVLLGIKGTMDKPAKGINLLGLGWKDTQYTYLDPHGMPSGGDWALQRTAALNIEGAESINIEQNLFTRLDGNGILISGYNRYITIQKNEFVWIGDSAIASWGNAQGSPVAGYGWDGTDGDHPEHNILAYNFVHELGIWEKQSSFYFQAKTCLTHIEGNIFFNGPRAGINFNDGFGGGSNITNNLILNTCRESGDHGPFNSWDRQVYVTTTATGKPSTLKAYDNIYTNFIIANYDSQEAIDNDDGSCYYNTHHNFLVYSGNGMKSDFGGHDNHHHHNIYAYVVFGFSLSGQLAGHEDYFYNNTLILTRDGTYGTGTCSGPGKTVVHDNAIYTPTANVQECGMALDKWQQLGNDPGSTANLIPADEQILSWAKLLLNI